MQEPSYHDKPFKRVRGYTLGRGELCSCMQRAEICLPILLPVLID